MSQKAPRKSQNAAATDEKEKELSDDDLIDDRQTDSPVKEMKKKLAANAEKEKQADKSDKNTEKPDNVPDKAKGDKQEKKVDKPAEKKVEKPAEKKVDKPAEKKAEKPVEKKIEKPAEKKSEQAEKKEEGKNEKNLKPQEKPKQNGKQENGTHNGTEEVTVSDSEDELVIEDECFPELTYDDTSDTDAFDDVARSYTRRSQVKSTKTPETPRPTSDKDEDAKESKILKLTEVPASDRKLRSADSPKPEQKKDDKTDDKASKPDDKASKTDDKAKKDDNKTAGQKEVEIVIEIDGDDKNESRMKTRARVSPYSRQQLHDQTSTSVMANYTGNNTTMEMDLSESSVSEEASEASAEDSAYLRAVRGMRGRASYRHMDLDLTQLLADRARRNAALNHSAPEASRPTGTVVGRKRKPEADVSVEVGREVTEGEGGGKRLRLLDTIAGGLGGLRRGLHGGRRAQAQIVGINTDLPLSAPVATPAFDPETLKTEAAPITTTPAPPTQEKRCIVM